MFKIKFCRKYEGLKVSSCEHLQNKYLQHRKRILRLKIKGDLYGHNQTGNIRDTIGTMCIDMY